ncbi:membrane protein [Hyphomicrobium nitrativorans NL23]|uniref:Membrane protein n=1 Tax=Hyphomicrobium nitrativorans NL23 TaxID=1029756 RepID=V5SEW3_9HYPH|nr:MTH938/NDUFAF3 family protein [Hyphomicrobium nitrativorans]AHB48590.1 membrane protein [Hyphomicrobium nitrativorans NL23]
MRPRAYLPRQVPIEAYGNGGFRFGGMSHRGSILCLPSGIWGWAPSSIGALDSAALQPLLDLASDLSFVILGTGSTLARAPRDVRIACEEVGLGLDVMDTGAAARTYNILLAEGRAIAAALIAVE